MAASQAAVAGANPADRSIVRVVEYLVGLIILGLCIVALVGGLLLRHFLWKKEMPKEEYRGVRYEFHPGCVEWTDMHLAIDTLFGELDRSKDVMAGLWIRVNPYDRPIRTSKVPTGFIAKSGMPTQPPKTEEEAAVTMVLNGLTEFEKKWPIGRSTAIVYVRQHRPSDSKIDARLLRGTGPIVADAARSTLFHEVVEHVNPYRKGEGTNGSHGRADLTELAKRCTVACLNRGRKV